MRPDFGCGLRRYLMEPNTPATRAAIAREVEAALRAWEPRIELGEVDVTRRPTTRARCSSPSATRHVRDQSPDGLPVPLPLAGGPADDDPAVPGARRPRLRPAPGRAARPDPRLRPGVDRPRAQRPRHHAAGAGRAPRRDAALPVQPDPRPDPAVAAAAARSVPPLPATAGDRPGRVHRRPGRSDRPPGAAGHDGDRGRRCRSGSATTSRCSRSPSPPSSRAERRRRQPTSCCATSSSACSTPTTSTGRGRHRTTRRCYAPRPDRPTDDELLDVGPAVDRCLWIAVHATAGIPGSPRTSGGPLLDPLGPLAREPIVLGSRATADDGPGSDDVAPCPGAGARREPRRRVSTDSSLVWQVTGADGTAVLPVGVVRDTTDGLRRSGVVALQLPAASWPRVGAPRPGRRPDLAGVGDVPACARRPARRSCSGCGPSRARASRTSGGCAGSASTPPTSSRSRRPPPEVLGSGHGLSHQELALAQSAGRARDPAGPGAGGRRRLGAVGGRGVAGGERPDGPAPAARRAGRAAARAGTACAAGCCRSGRAVRAPRYRYGGGRRGQRRRRGRSAVVEVAGVTRDEPAAHRAAARTPSPSPARWSASPASSPATTARSSPTTSASSRPCPASAAPSACPCSTRAPATDGRRRRRHRDGVAGRGPAPPRRPTPTQTLLRAVCARLDARRLVTTELFVVPPTYHRVAVSVGIAVKPGYSTIGVRRWVELVLRQYLSPLPPFGPEGGAGRWATGSTVPSSRRPCCRSRASSSSRQLLVADLAGGRAGRRDGRARRLGGRPSWSSARSSSAPRPRRAAAEPLPPPSPRARPPCRCRCRGTSADGRDRSDRRGRAAGGARHRRRGVAGRAARRHAGRRGERRGPAGAAAGRAGPAVGHRRAGGRARRARLRPRRLPLPRRARAWTALAHPVAGARGPGRPVPRPGRGARAGAVGFRRRRRPPSPGAGMGRGRRRRRAPVRPRRRDRQRRRAGSPRRAPAPHDHPRRAAGGPRVRSGRGSTRRRRIARPPARGAGRGGHAESGAARRRGGRAAAAGARRGPPGPAHRGRGRGPVAAAARRRRWLGGCAARRSTRTAAAGAGRDRARRRRGGPAGRRRACRR